MNPTNDDQANAAGLRLFLLAMAIWVGQAIAIGVLAY